MLIRTIVIVLISYRKMQNGTVNRSGYEKMRLESHFFISTSVSSTILNFSVRCDFFRAFLFRFKIFLAFFSIFLLRKSFFVSQVSAFYISTLRFFSILKKQSFDIINTLCFLSIKQGAE